MLKKISMGIILTISLGLTGIAGATTIMASSCSQADVQAAIDRALTSDTVRVPTGNCTWATNVAIPNSKKITLQGGGIGATILTASSYGDLIQMNQSGSRVTGLELVNGYILADGDGWRIDHCKIANASGGEGVYIRGSRETQHPTGLIDHCIFNNTRVNIYGWAGLIANAQWMQPLNLGSGSNVVYVEDCTFTHAVFGNAIDSNYGGRYVFRYNTLNDVYVESHSLQGNDRASQKWEIYNNTFNQVSRSMWVPIFMRGGTGVIFNNTLTGNWDSSRIAIDNYRSCNTATTSGKCDGNSPWDGNEQNGYPCRDQIGRSSDAYLWNVGTPYPPQALDPAYAWNNKNGSNNVTFIQHGCAASVAHIQPGRDYFDNMVKPGYTPYTYPHPLINSWGSTITPPQGFRLSMW